MNERILKWLYAIQLAIAEIDSYFENIERNFISYQKNTMLKRAVERNLEIIGKAVTRILKREPSFTESITNARAIIGLRNQVIHAYDNISYENIWSILITHLPKLKSEVNELILASE